MEPPCIIGLPRTFANNTGSGREVMIRRLIYEGPCCKSCRRQHADPELKSSFLVGVDLLIQWVVTIMVLSEVP